MITRSFTIFNTLALALISLRKRFQVRFNRSVSGFKGYPHTSSGTDPIQVPRAFCLLGLYLTIFISK